MHVHGPVTWPWYISPLTCPSIVSPTQWVAQCSEGPNGVCSGGPIYGQHSLVMQWMEHLVTQAGILGLQYQYLLCFCVCVSHLALIPPPNIGLAKRSVQVFPYDVCLEKTRINILAKAVSLKSKPFFSIPLSLPPYPSTPPGSGPPSLESAEQLVCYQVLSLPCLKSPCGSGHPRQGFPALSTLREEPGPAVTAGGERPRGFSARSSPGHPEGRWHPCSPVPWPLRLEGLSGHTSWENSDLQGRGAKPGLIGSALLPSGA